MRADSLASTEEVSQLSTSTSEQASLSNKYVRGTLSFLPQVEWTLRYPDSKKARFPCSGLNAASCLISEDEGMSESAVETIEKALVFRIISKQASHPSAPREACGVQCFNR